MWTDMILVSHTQFRLTIVFSTYNIDFGKCENIVFKVCEFAEF